MHIEPYRVDKVKKDKTGKNNKKQLTTGAAKRVANKKETKGFQKSLKPKAVAKKENANKAQKGKEKKTKEFLGTKSGDKKKVGVFLFGFIGFKQCFQFV